MSDEAPLFRVRSVLRCAFELDEDGAPPPTLPLNARPAALAARAVVRRIERSDPVLREVGKALVDAIDSLEQEVERLRLRLDLADVGIQLQPELVELGGDGMTLAKGLPYPPGSLLRVWVELPLSGSSRLLCTAAEVLPGVPGSALRFVNTQAEVRDRIVAFTFQHQALERRRARDHAG